MPLSVGSDLQKLKVPVGGDQLILVRLQGTMNLRLGAHTAAKRFDLLGTLLSMCKCKKECKISPVYAENVCNVYLLVMPWILLQYKTV